MSASPESGPSSPAAYHVGSRLLRIELSAGVQIADDNLAVGVQRLLRCDRQNLPPANVLGLYRAMD